MQVNPATSSAPDTFDLKKTVNKLYDELAETLLQGIVNQSITGELSQEIAQTILQQLDKIENRAQLLEFLQKLSTQWAAYNPFYIKLKYEDEQKKDQEKLKDVQATLQQFMQNTYASRTTIS